MRGRESLFPDNQCGKLEREEEEDTGEKKYTSPKDVSRKDVRERVESLVTKAGISH